MPKLDTKFYDGVYIGLKEDTDELLIGTGDGVFIARTIRRKPWDHRWSSSQIKNISGTPWKPYRHTNDDTLRSSLPASENHKTDEPKQPPTETTIPDASGGERGADRFYLRLSQSRMLEPNGIE